MYFPRGTGVLARCHSSERAFKMLVYKLTSGQVFTDHILEEVFLNKD